MKFATRFIKGLLLIFIVVGQVYGQDQLSWLPTNSPQGTVFFLSSQKKHLFAGIHNQGVYRSSDLGDTWERVDQGIASLMPHCMLASDKYFFVGTNNGIYRCLQDDLKWERKEKGLTSIKILSLAQNDKTIFAGTNQGIFQSRDEGETWEQAKLPQPIGVSRNIYALLVTKDNNIIAGTSRGVYLSANEGNTWVLLDAGTPHDVASLATDGKVIYLGTSGDQIIETERLSFFGKGIKQTQGLSNVQALVVVDSALYSGGNLKGIVKDTQKIDRELPFDGIRSIAVQDKVLFGGTLKFGVWKYALKPKKLHDIELAELGKAAAQQYGMKVFPNPAPKTGDRKISYWLSSTEKVEIQVFNTLGTLVYKADLGISAPGKYDFNLEGNNNLQAGMYVCTLRIGNKLLIEKLIFSE